MKKIIYTILILFAFIYKVDAKEIYYSDYSDFSDYTLEKQEPSELVNVEVERRYRFYKDEIIGEYRSYLDNNSSFEFIDLNNKKESSFSGWSDIEPIEEDYRSIESKTVYKVKRPKPIRYIFFVNTLDTTLQLSDIEVYYLEQKIDYDLYFDNADKDLSIYNGGYVRLDLKNYYDLKDITIKIKIIDFNNTREFIVTVSREAEFDFFKHTYFSTNIKNNNSNNILINKKNWVRAFAEYEDEVVLDYNPNEPLSEITEVKFYRYKDPLFYFYNIERKYLDGYFKNYDNLIKDENDYKDYYRYQLREKIELEDKIIITNYEQSLSDFIKSTVDYEIITNLDISKNGTYEVEYKTAFINVKKDVIVDIEENKLHSLEDKYNNLVSKFNDLKNKYDSLNSQLIRVNEEKKNLTISLEELQSLYNGLNKKVEEIKNYDDLVLELEKLKNIYIQINNELLEVKNNNANLNFKLEELKDINEAYIEENHKLNLQLEKINSEFIRIDKNYNTLNSIINNNDNKFKSEITILANNYNNLLNKYQELKNNDCKLELNEALTKINNNNDRLDLIEFTNKQLQNNLLTLGDKSNLSIGKIDLLWIILGLIFIFIIFLIFVKKLSNKNKL